jgi:hypothetical protein
VTARAFRGLGLLPIAFFAAYLASAAQENRAGDALWLCHVSNLLLGLGLLLDKPAWIRIAVPWIVLGIPLWVIDMLSTGQVCPVSTVSHVGGLGVGLYAVRRVGAGVNAWIGALAWLVAMQTVARLATPESLNVNLAWRPYEGFEGWPGGYPFYWVSLVAGAAVTLWIIGQLLRRAFAPRAAIPEGSSP